MKRDSGKSLPAGPSAPLVRLLTGGAEGQDHALVESLALEVIARLDRKARVAPPDSVQIGRDAVNALCDALLSAEELRAADLVHAAVAAGVDVDTLHLAYLGEAAREMGRRWEEDRASAAQVIIGAGRIYRILRQLRERFLSARPRHSPVGRVVFAAVPGETHTLGLTIAADYMRRRGLEVDVRTGMDHATLVDQISHEDYAVIGLSAGTSASVFPLTRLIVALRISNPRAWIVVGGNIVETVPDIVTLVDADGAVHSAEDAAAHLEAVMNPQRGHGLP